MKNINASGITIQFDKSSHLGSKDAQTAEILYRINHLLQENADYVNNAQILTDDDIDTKEINTDD